MNVNDLILNLNDGDNVSANKQFKTVMADKLTAALDAKKMFQYCHNDKKYVFRYTTSSKDIQEKLGVK